MSYLVLARKYRPESFDTVSGQEHVTRTLSNAITREQVGHAYVLTGPRGVGKTSIARIFAKCLNCEQGPTNKPCLECTNCQEIMIGTSLAVREIDGASNNSVDNVRELIESFRTLPAPGSKYKVYIIDEVHMLSLSAFNALLKSLEEPPPNTVFILATTEPHKIPDTVLSRCQRHDLRALPLTTISQRLEQIAGEENLTIEPQALKMLAKLSDGSMRDAQTLLERVRAYSDGTISGQEVSTILGTVDLQVLLQIAEAVFEHNSAAVLKAVETVFARGADEAVFLRELVTFFRDLFVVKICDQSDAASFGIMPDEYTELKTLIAEVDQSDLSDLSDMARTGADKALRSSFPRYAMESLVVRMALRPPVRDMGKMVKTLRGMVKASSSKGATVAAAPIAAAPRSAPKSPPKSAAAQKKNSTPPVVELVPDEGDAESLNIPKLIKYLEKQNAPVLAEHLKRVSIIKSAGGVFAAQGPAFVIGSLQQADNQQRFRELLLAFSEWPKCNVRLQVSNNGERSEPGSIQHSLETETKQRRDEQKKKLVKDKTVQLVREIFPGSKIEQIRLKETGNG